MAPGHGGVGRELRAALQPEAELRKVSPAADRAHDAKPCRRAASAGRVREARKGDEPARAGGVWSRPGPDHRGDEDPVRASASDVATARARRREEAARSQRMDT